jgi:FkbM family methyltransferase
MTLKGIASNGIRRAIGASMRAYRASPFYPQCGPMLAKVLATVMRDRATGIIHDIDGVRFELDLRELIDASLFYSGTFEVEAERTITEALKPGMIAFDIGANMGYHTFRMAKAVGTSGKVYAIEPTAGAFNKLQRNISLNSIKNIYPLKLALGERDEGLIELRVKSSYRLDGTDLTGSELIPMRTLDALIKENAVNHVDFLKMDVDGYEAKVVRGAIHTLEHHRPIMFFEITPSILKNNENDFTYLLSMLDELGYHVKSEAGKPIENLVAYLDKVPVGFATNLFAAHAGG